MVMISPNAASAVASGCDPGGVRKSAPMNCALPTRRTVTERSPSCTGSRV